MLRADIKVSWIKMRAETQFLWEKNCKSYGTLAAGADCTLCPDSGGALIASNTGRKSFDCRDAGCHGRVVF
jgi:Zn-finger protein